MGSVGDVCFGSHEQVSLHDDFFFCSSNSLLDAAFLSDILKCIANA